MMDLTLHKAIRYSAEMWKLSGDLVYDKKDALNALRLKHSEIPDNVYCKCFICEWVQRENQKKCPASSIWGRYKGFEYRSCNFACEYAPNSPYKKWRQARVRGNPDIYAKIIEVGFRKLLAKLESGEEDENSLSQ